MKKEYTAYRRNMIGDMTDIFGAQGIRNSFYILDYIIIYIKCTKIFLNDLNEKKIKMNLYKINIIIYWILKYLTLMFSFCFNLHK